MHLLPYTVAHAFFIQLSNYYADASRRAVSRTLPTTSLLLIKKRMAAKKKKVNQQGKGRKKNELLAGCPAVCVDKSDDVLLRVYDACWTRAN